MAAERQTERIELAGQVYEVGPPIEGLQFWLGRPGERPVRIDILTVLPCWVAVVTDVVIGEDGDDVGH